MQNLLILANVLTHFKLQLLFYYFYLVIQRSLVYLKLKDKYSETLELSWNIEPNLIFVLLHLNVGSIEPNSKKHRNIEKVRVPQTHV